MNVPGAKSKQAVKDSSKISALINDFNPKNNATLIELPDIAKKSCKRGLADEEREFEEQYWGLKQHVDTRWILPFDLQSGSEASGIRRDGILFDGRALSSLGL